MGAGVMAWQFLVEVGDGGDRGLGAGVDSGGGTTSGVSRAVIMS